MKHDDALAERMQFPGGRPSFQTIHRLSIGKTVEKMLKADLAVEMEAIPLLKDAIAHCETVRDYTTREIFERIPESEGEHVEFLAAQFDIIERMRLPNCAPLQFKPAGEGD